LVRWDDSLRTVSTSAALRRYEVLSRQGAGVGGLRRALFLLRRGELGHSGSNLDQVVFEATFETLSGDRSAWWTYALSRAYVSMELSHWIPDKPDGTRRPEESFGDAAWRMLRTTLDRDPELTPARQLLIALLVPGGDRVLRDDQLEPLRREIGRGAPDPDALLVWARHVRALRLYDSALVVFDRAQALGGDRSRLALERARTLRALHDTAAAHAAYWDGLAHLTSAGREMYRYDLAWLIGADSLAVFDRVPSADVPAWMHRFWDQRDAAAANTPGERLDEDLRRWDVVLARYRVRSPWRRNTHDEIDMFFDNDDCIHRDAALYDLLWKLPPHHPGDIRDRELLLDHRGIMYLRHGNPIEVIGGWALHVGPEDFVDGPAADLPDSSGVWSPWDKWDMVPMFGTFDPHMPFAGVPYQMGNPHSESWLYLIDGQRIMLNFRPSDAVGTYDATTLSSYLPYQPTAWLARSGATPAFHEAGERIAAELKHPSPGGNPPTCWDQVRAAVTESRADADNATHNDSDSPPLVYPFAAVTQLFALGTGAQHSSEALITFALGGNALQGDSLAGGGIAYRVHFRATAWNRSSGATATIDTIRIFATSHVIAPTERLTAWLQLPLPAGEWQVAVKATQRDDSAGAFVIAHDMHIDRGDALALSDIVTGIAGSPSWIATDGEPFPINAVASWPVGSAVQIYYEVHGLPAGAAYRTTVQLVPADIKAAHAPTPLRIQSSDLSTGPLTVIRRSLGIEQLPPGRYRLTVTVAASGRSATRTAAVMIEK
jgi:hypothetical protein